jgi:glucokinase
MEKRCIGVDLGGTNIKVGVVDPSGNLLYKAERPTGAEDGVDAVIARITSSAREAAEASGTSWNQIAGIGVGLPGFLDISRGVVKRLTNLPWENVPIRELLEKAWNRPVMIDNDANVAALGEAWSGAGTGVSDLVCITLGTGVGGGVIAGGRLIHGVGGAAGEIGHIRIEEDGALCGCGQRGCLETIASATGIVRMVKEMVSSGRETALAAAVRADTLSTRDVFREMEAGDPVAEEVIDRATDALAQAMATLSVILNPARFIIGGGVARAGEALFRPLRRAYQKRALPSAAEGVTIVPAQLGNDAGVIGAAGLVAHGGNGNI